MLPLYHKRKRKTTQSNLPLHLPSKLEATSGVVNSPLALHVAEVTMSNIKKKEATRTSREGHTDGTASTYVHPLVLVFRVIVLLLFFPLCVRVPTDKPKLSR